MDADHQHAPVAASSASARSQTSTQHARTTWCSTSTAATGSRSPSTNGDRRVGRQHAQRQRRAVAPRDGTAGADGISLYVDGRRVGRDQTPVSMATFQGFWRLFADQTSSLPNRPPTPASSGTIDEVAVFPTRC